MGTPTSTDTDTQAHRHTGTQAHSHVSSHLFARFFTVPQSLQHLFQHVKA